MSSLPIATIAATVTLIIPKLSARCAVRASKSITQSRKEVLALTQQVLSAPLISGTVQMVMPKRDGVTSVTLGRNRGRTQAGLNMVLPYSNQRLQPSKQQCLAIRGSLQRNHSLYSGRPKTDFVRASSPPLTVVTLVSCLRA